MSGGFIEEQGQYEHQVVIITFKGTITKGQRTKWNDAIYALKAGFGSNVIAVTTKGNSTPQQYRNGQGGGAKGAKKKLSTRRK